MYFMVLLGTESTQGVFFVSSLVDAHVGDRLDVKLPPGCEACQGKHRHAPDLHGHLRVSSTRSTHAQNKENKLR